MRKFIYISSIVFCLASLSAYSQDSIPNNSNSDSIRIDKLDFLNYKIETLNTIVSLQSQSIENLNLMIQLLNIEIMEKKKELDCYCSESTKNKGVLKRSKKKPTKEVQSSSINL